MTSLLQITLASLLLVAAAAGSRSPRKVEYCGTPENVLGAVLAAIDGYNDCCITMDEATEFYMANGADQGWETWNDERVRAGLQKGFGETDTNNDGCLTRTELVVHYCAVKEGVFTVPDDQETLLAALVLEHDKYHVCA